ncbi:putative RNA methyltransferase At5g10620 isoform X6 [Malania oleifera]|uniref:putative RNA methyltransferase At5g10620 isoform X6 n=1 Tax=Malania oleifera TaxID=397392 RepID=UPI0025AEC1AA|nr:putative RNA methyltransferase At5g10620 isoform X6 [Malania oleifera]
MAISLRASFSPSCVSPQSPGRLCKYTGQSVRALPVRFLTVGKKRLSGVQLLVDEYIEKLRCYCAVEDVQVRSNPKNARDVKAQIEDEDMAVMSLIRSDDWGASRLSFCIGGPYGHGRLLRERANISIKLSSLVLNHQIALVVLIEQLYSDVGQEARPWEDPCWRILKWN